MVVDRLKQQLSFPEVGIEGYDEGAKILQQFFHSELQKYLKDDLFQTGKNIIEACLSNASVEEYNEILPMNYEYSFYNINDYEQK